jgi:dephospho-CoA kinase
MIIGISGKIGSGKDTIAKIMTIMMDSSISLIIMVQ